MKKGFIKGRKGNHVVIIYFGDYDPDWDKSYSFTKEGTTFHISFHDSLKEVRKSMVKDIIYTIHPINQKKVY